MAAGAPPVLRVATGRARFPARQTAVVVGIVVLALVLDEFIPSGFGVAIIVVAVVLAAVWYRPRMVATTADDVLVLSATWSQEPRQVLHRIARSDWRPRRTLGTVAQAVGDEMIALDTFGQRDMLPDGTSGEPVR